nr:dynein axonemal heavy chain 2-like [Caretta caretta]
MGVLCLIRVSGACLAATGPQVQTIVNEYKAATLAIARSAQQISEALLVRITGKRVYNDLEFEEDQKEHRAWVQQKLMDIHEEVTSIMRQTYEVFKHDSAEVQQYWMAYTIKMNRMMEEAFRLNVKWSLLELSKAINGDGKTTPNPLFRVKVILQNNYPAPSAQVEFPQLWPSSRIWSMTSAATSSPASLSSATCRRS